MIIWKETLVFRTRPLFEPFAVVGGEVVVEGDCPVVEEPDVAFVVAHRQDFSAAVDRGREGDVENAGLEGGDRAFPDIALAQLEDLFQNAVDLALDDRLLALDGARRPDLRCSPAC